MARPKTLQPEDPNKLKRERAGRYVTGDARFAIEGGGAGSWYLVDGERLNELGLPVVDGPWATLDEARTRLGVVRAGAPVGGDAVAGSSGGSAPGESAGAQITVLDLAIRESAPELSPTEQPDATVLPAEFAREPDVPAPAGPGAAVGGITSAPPRRRRTAAPATTAPASRRPRRTRPLPDASRAEATLTLPRATAPPGEPTAPPEPTWLTRRSPADQAAARRLLARLTRLGITDATLARREIEGNVAEVAKVLFARRVRRSALDPWRDDGTAAEAIAGLRAGAPRQLQDAVASRIAAAERVLAGSGSAADARAFAWLVAVATTARIVETIEDEGDQQRAVGDPGWRLMELDGRREPTGRPVPVGPGDLVEPDSDET